MAHPVRLSARLSARPLPIRVFPSASILLTKLGGALTVGRALGQMLVLRVTFLKRRCQSASATTKGLEEASRTTASSPVTLTHLPGDLGEFLLSAEAAK